MCWHVASSPIYSTKQNRWLIDDTRERALSWWKICRCQNLIELNWIERERWAGQHIHCCDSISAQLYCLSICQLVTSNNNIPRKPYWDLRSLVAVGLFSVFCSVLTVIIHLTSDSLASLLFLQFHALITTTMYHFVLVACAQKICALFNNRQRETLESRGSIKFNYRLSVDTNNMWTERRNSICTSHLVYFRWKRIKTLSAWPLSGHVKFYCLLLRSRSRLLSFCEVSRSTQLQCAGKLLHSASAWLRHVRVMRKFLSLIHSNATVLPPSLTSEKWGLERNYAKHWAIYFNLMIHYDMRRYSFQFRHYSRSLSLFLFCFLCFLSFKWMWTLTMSAFLVGALITRPQRHCHFSTRPHISRLRCV